MEKVRVTGVRIKIVSDGTSNGTKVVDAVTGEAIPNVKSVEWRIEAKGLATAVLTLVRVPLEVEAQTVDVPA